MINYDKLEKVCEYDGKGSPSWFTDDMANVIYIMKIGEESYIGSTKDLKGRVHTHITDLKRCKHTKAVSEAFSDVGSFTVYSLERINEPDALRKREQFYIDLLSPSLNGTNASSDKVKKGRMRLRIREVCQMRGITQKELAERLGVSEVTLSRASNGNTSLQLLERIAEELSIEVYEIFTSSGNEGVLKCPRCGAKLRLVEADAEANEPIE